MKLLHETVGSILRRQARNFTELDAAVYYNSGIKYSWGALDSETDKVAKGLIRIGVGKGDHVAVWGTNVPAWLLTQLAVARIGAVLVTINPEWKEAELEYALRQSDSKVLVMIDGFEKAAKNRVHKYDYLRMIRNLCPELERSNQDSQGRFERFPVLEKIVLISKEAESGMMLWDELLEKGLSISFDQLNTLSETVSADDVSMIQYTSGTTGFPKGAMLTHYSTVNNAIATSEHMHLTYTDRVCGPVPYYHCFGSIIFNLGCVVSGACMVVPGDIFDPVNTLKAIDKERCTAVYGVPTMFITQLESPGFEQYDLKNLRTGVIAGAPVDKELMEAVAGKMGASEMTIAYGLTEASPVTHQTDIHDSVWHRVNTVGKPISNTKSKIVDPNTLEDCPKGSVGEIWVKGYHVMKGYYKKPEETDKSLIDGWLRTGDLGFITEDNYYRISGRLKEMIIVGGHNVYPAEVEQSLHSLLEDKVEILQVVGIPDHKLQEVVALIVKCLPGESLSLQEVKTRCEGKLEWPKIPRVLKVLDDLTPYMTVSGKVQKFKLKELLTMKSEQV